MSATVLVTGAAGFIGSHTVEALLQRGDRVIGLDNLDPYYEPVRKHSNLQEVGATAARVGSAFVFQEGDVRDRRLLGAVLDENPPDCIVHLAAMPGVGASVRAPHLYWEVNLTGTLNLLEAAHERGVRRFVFASTSSTYGATSRIPFVEDDNADRPLAPYPASKRAAELLGHSYSHLHGLQFTALRFFTCYGPRGRPDMLAYRAMDNLYRRAPLALYDGGSLQRDWTYVADIVAGIVAAVDRPQRYEVINIGRGAPISVSDFVRALERASGRETKVSGGSLPESDMKATYASIEKARALLGYQPKVSVDEGVARTLAWYHERVLGEGSRRP